MTSVMATPPRSVVCCRKPSNRSPSSVPAVRGREPGRRRPSHGAAEPNAVRDVACGGVARRGHPAAGHAFRGPGPVPCRHPARQPTLGRGALRHARRPCRQGRSPRARDRRDARARPPSRRRGAVHRAETDRDAGGARRRGVGQRARDGLAGRPRGARHAAGGGGYPRALRASEGGSVAFRPRTSRQAARSSRPTSTWCTTRNASSRRPVPRTRRPQTGSLPPTSPEQVSRSDRPRSRDRTIPRRAGRSSDPRAPRGAPDRDWATRVPNADAYDYQSLVAPRVNGAVASGRRLFDSGTRRSACGAQDARRATRASGFSVSVGWSTTLAPSGRPERSSAWDSLR